jgi:hypothetical protein
LVWVAQLFPGARRNADGTVTAHLRPTGSSADVQHTFHHVTDCLGIGRDTAQHAAGVVRCMLSDGLTHVASLRPGIAVDCEAPVLRPDGPLQAAWRASRLTGSEQMFARRGIITKEKERRSALLPFNV